MRLDGVTAIVSGAASGLGEATAREFASCGATVVVADVDVDRGKAVADDISGTFVATDVRDEAAVAAAVDQAANVGPPLRVAVCCAGVAPASRTVERDGTPHPADLFEDVLRINLIGTFNLVKHAASAIRGTQPTEDGDRGVIVMTASITATEGQVGQAAYAASKAGVAGLVLPVARDLAFAGIRVCCIAPGVFDTPLVGAMPKPQRAELARDIVYPRRLGRPPEYAAAARSIVENGYLNGMVLRLDGALRMPPM
jgi:NAD(P)-dependent dehydrogenase (short-subunit alcohol dehydrogenase family)